MLVIMRLPDKCSQLQEHKLEDRIKAYGSGRDQGARQEVRGLRQPRSEYIHLDTAIPKRF